MKVSRILGKWVSTDSLPTPLALGIGYAVVSAVIAALANLFFGDVFGWWASGIGLLVGAWTAYEIHTGEPMEKLFEFDEAAAFGLIVWVGSSFIIWFFPTWAPADIRNELLPDPLGITLKIGLMSLVVALGADFVRYAWAALQRTGRGRSI